jgi:hypothetical protein
MTFNFIFTDAAALSSHGPGRGSRTTRGANFARPLDAIP